jgi:hypothetical protein
MSVWADVDTSIGTFRVEASEATLTGSDLEIAFRIEPKARDYTIRSMTMHLGDQTGECPGQLYAARGEIWEAFNAIREHFLDEFDIDEPSRPILIHQMKRLKRDGATREALERKDRQAKLAANHKRS